MQVHTTQDKAQKSNSVKKESESTPKAAKTTADATRLPAWMGAWGNNVPSELSLLDEPTAAQDISTVSQPGDRYEQEADDTAGHATQALMLKDETSPKGPEGSIFSFLPFAGMSHVAPMIQRAPADDTTPTSTTTSQDTTSTVQSSVAATTEPNAENETANEPLSAPFIVEDDATDLGPGQMKKSEFLAQLRDAVCTTVEEALKGTMWSAVGCPWVDHWFGYYGNRSSSQIERAIQKYAPDTTTVTSASDYIPLICDRVRKAIATWSATGEVTGVPEGISTALPTTPTTSSTSTASAAQGAGPETESMQLKPNEGSTGKTGDPQAIRGQLGAGSSIGGSVKSRMESAFGVDFSPVRMHTDARAAALSSNLHARAFTVGEHVAFGAGEYQPGTPVGDALIAHELAHVLQQRGAALPVPQQKGGVGYNSLEEDADISAMGAVVSLWDVAKGTLTDIAQNAIPRLRTGLGLQRCALFRPQLKNPQDVQRESDAIQKEILAALPPGSEIQKAVNHEIAVVNAVYRNELKAAGANTDKQAEAQDKLLKHLHVLRESYKLQLELFQRYGISFSVGIHVQGKPTAREMLIGVWPEDELKSIDSILKRVPKVYLDRVGSIEREPWRNGKVGAAWVEGAEGGKGKIAIYDAFFDRDQQKEKPEMLLHEIGHSTDQPRTVNNFKNLPNPEWMALSDWKTSTRQSLGADLGLSKDDLKDALEDLKDEKKRRSDFPRPISIKKRMVVIDRYEDNADDPDAEPQQFLHYAEARDQEFVTDYARSHPADDLAESFAHYLLDRGGTEYDLDRDSKRPGGNKWNYLERHYKERLK